MVPFKTVVDLQWLSEMIMNLFNRPKKTATLVMFNEELGCRQRAATALKHPLMDLREVTLIA